MNAHDENFVVFSHVTPVRMQIPGFGFFSTRVLRSQADAEAFVAEMRKVAHGSPGPDLIDLSLRRLPERERRLVDAAFRNPAATSFSHSAITSWVLIKAAEESSAATFLVRTRSETSDVDVFCKAVLTRCDQQLPLRDRERAAVREIAKFHRAVVL